MKEEDRKIMEKLYRTDPNFKALLHEIQRLEIEGCVMKKKIKEDKSMSLEETMKETDRLHEELHKVRQKNIRNMKIACVLMVIATILSGVLLLMKLGGLP